MNFPVGNFFVILLYLPESSACCQIKNYLPGIFYQQMFSLTADLPVLYTDPAAYPEIQASFPQITF